MRGAPRPSGHRRLPIDACEFPEYRCKLRRAGCRKELRSPAFSWIGILPWRAAEIFLKTAGNTASDTVFPGHNSLYGKRLESSGQTRKMNLTPVPQLSAARILNSISLPTAASSSCGVSPSSRVRKRIAALASLAPLNPSPTMIFWPLRSSAKME